MNKKIFLLSGIALFTASISTPILADAIKPNDTAITLTQVKSESDTVTTSLSTPTLQIDPIALAKASQAAAVILPDGTYAKIFGPSMTKLMSPIIDQAMELPIRDLAKIGGVSKAELDKLSPAKTSEIMAILDPAFKQRVALIIDTMFTEMTPMLTEMEPSLRDGMAQSFVKKYNATELDEITKFLSTPAGAKFGSGFMTLATDPDYLEKVQSMIPQIMQAMPGIMRKVLESTKTLPSPRQYSQLSRAEKAKLDGLLGIKSSKRK